MTSGSAIFAGKTLDLRGLGPGGDRRKSIYLRHLRAKFYALRTEKGYHLRSKIEYNRGMMNPNADSNLTDADFDLMDKIFLAGWEFGKANISQTATEALILFKMAISQPDLTDPMDAAIKAGIKKTDALWAADAKKNAEMN